MDELGNTYNIFVGESQGKGLIGRHRRRWDNTKMDGQRELVWT